MVDNLLTGIVEIPDDKLQVAEFGKLQILLYFFFGARGRNNFLRTGIQLELRTASCNLVLTQVANTSVFLERGEEIISCGREFSLNCGRQVVTWC
jgi:hypothetical protein